MDQQEFGAAKPGEITPSFPHFPQTGTIKPNFQSVDDSVKTHRNIPSKEEKVMK